MADGSILSRYSDRFGPEGPDEASSAGTDDFGSFGWLRGLRERATMLELRRRDGTILALGYGWLEKALFDPSRGIALHFVSQTIEIQGRNLNAEIRPFVRLFEGIAKQRVTWIRELSRADATAAADDACVVESLRW